MLIDLLRLAVNRAIWASRWACGSDGPDYRAMLEELPLYSTHSRWAFACNAASLYRVYPFWPRWRAGESRDTGRIFRRVSAVALWWDVAVVVPWCRSAFDFASAANRCDVSKEVMAYGIAAHMLLRPQHYLKLCGDRCRQCRDVFLRQQSASITIVSGFWAYRSLALMVPSRHQGQVVHHCVAQAFRSDPVSAVKACAEGEARHQTELGYGMAASSIVGCLQLYLRDHHLDQLVAGTLYGMVIHTIGFVFVAFLGIGTATSVRVAEALGRNECRMPRMQRVSVS